MTVFLSYHSSREPVAEHLARYLSKRGVSTWYAPRDVPPGAVWDETISSAIRNCSALILLFCTSADSSPHVKREIMLADRAHLPIYWLRLERVEPDKLGYLLGSTQWIDWLDERDSTLETLVRDLQRVDADGGGTAGRSAVPAPQVTQISTSRPSGEGGSHRRRHPSDRHWPRGLLALPSERHAAEVAARVYFRVAQACPDSAVILPTGRSATHVFRAMLRIAGEFGPRPFGEAHILTDTETFGVWPGHHTSRSRHVRETLIDPLIQAGYEVDDQQLHLLTGIIMERDPLKEAQRTVRLWPPAVHAVSVAPTGEVLAYEVGTYNDPSDFVDDGVRIIELSEHGKGYIDPEQPSRSVLSIGFGTALSAQTLLILLFDSQKAAILYRMLVDEPTAGIPATLLQRHLNAHVLTTTKIVDEIGLAEFASTPSIGDAVDLILEQS